jgi:hypothetical protein
VAGDADHRREGAAFAGLWREQVAEQGHAGLGFDDELFAAVGGEVADFKGDGTEGRFRFREAADEIEEFGAELFLPGFGGAFVGGFVGKGEGALAWRVIVQATGSKLGRATLLSKPSRAPV